ncbi:MAG: hypothetical protein WBV96_21225, partial [Polyangia bacterium]
MRRSTPATRLLALPPIAAGLDRDTGEAAGGCPVASGVARVPDRVCVANLFGVACLTEEHDRSGCHV